MSKKESAQVGEKVLEGVGRLSVARSAFGVLTTVVLVGAAIAAGVAALTSSSSVFLLTSFIGATLIVIMRTSLVRYRNSLRRQLLEAPAQLDEQMLALTRHMLESGPREEYELAKSEKAIRASNGLLFVMLGLAVLAVCLSLIPLVSKPKTPQLKPDAGVVPDKADEVVVRYKAQILDLRGDAEARYPGWELEVRSRGKGLANLIGAVDERRLSPARKIIQHEYRGWAFLMVADTFADVQPRDEKILYAEKAITEFDLALERMTEVTQQFEAGVRDIVATYEWMTGSSEDLNRTRYLRAVALAVLARSGAGRLGSVKDELAKIDPHYLEQFPAKNNPNLLWVQDQIRSADERRDKTHQ